MTADVAEIKALLGVGGMTSVFADLNALIGRINAHIGAGAAHRDLAAALAAAGM